MSTQPEISTDAAARAVLQELDTQVLEADRALSDSPVAGEAGAADVAVVDQQVKDATEAARVEALRNRAQRERKRGIDNLARRHSGIASLMRNVSINERVVGSTFERYFSTIESGIYIINKLGGFVVGESAADKLIDSVETKIKNMEASASEVLGQLAIVLEAHKERTDWLVPEYSDAAAKHQVQLRSVLANRLLNVLLKYDEHLVKLNQLVWNGEAEVDEIENREYEIKKDVRDLAQYIRRALVGMQKKTQPKAAPAAAVAAAAEPTANDAAPQALAA